MSAAPGIRGPRGLHPMLARALILSTLLSLVGFGSVSPQSVMLLGRLLDADTGEPIEGAVVELIDFGGAVVTDDAGSFRMTGIVPGSYELRVRHLAYGVHTEPVEVPGDRDSAIELRLSQQALELAPIDVEVLRRIPTESTRSNVITRDQIRAVQGRARHIGDLVRTYIPGAQVSEARGGYLCLEFRGARNSRTTGCNFPLVVLDGLTVPSPAGFLRDLRLADLERIEFVPASEGGVRYGPGATHGVLVIETRRSGIVEDSRPPPSSRYPSYAWAQEPGDHAVLRTFSGAAIGVVAGTAMGLAAIGCFPESEGSRGTCVEGAGVGSGLAALALPLLGSTVLARFFGSTPHSRGRLLPSIGMTAIPAALGYAVYVEGSKSGFRGEEVLGSVLVVVGAPLVSTLADHLFRSRR